MADILIPVDDEAHVVDELAAGMRVPVGTRIPNPRPRAFVRVISTGGGSRDLVTDSPTLVIEGFASTESHARHLCATAVGHLQAAGRAGSVGGAVCYGVHVVGLPANLPLPSVPDRFRFTATVSIDLRRATA